MLQKCVLGKSQRDYYLPILNVFGKSERKYTIIPFLFSDKAYVSEAIILIDL